MIFRPCYAAEPLLDESEGPGPDLGAHPGPSYATCCESVCVVFMPAAAGAVQRYVGALGCAGVYGSFTAWVVGAWCGYAVRAIAAGCIARVGVRQRPGASLYVQLGSVINAAAAGRGDTRRASVPTASVVLSLRSAPHTK